MIYNRKFLFISMIIVLLISTLIYLCSTQKKSDKDNLYENKISEAKNSKKKSYGVASNNPIAVKIGEKIIEDGGNSVDASIGVSYALAITEPHTSGLGGGGAMITKNNSKFEKPRLLEYKDMSGYNYKKSDETGVPGLVSGLHQAHKNGGSMDEKKIMNYVIPLAKDGFEVDDELDRSLKIYGDDIDKDSPFFKDSEPLEEGDIVKQKALTKTLEGIRDNGVSYFYDDIAGDIADQADSHLKKKDFKNYQPADKEAIETDYKGNKIYSASNPLGGTLMAQGLKLDEIINKKNTKKEYVNSIISGRNLVLENKEIVNDQESAYNNYLERDYIIDKYKELDKYNGMKPSDGTDGNTTHFVVIDKEGQVTSTTNSLASYFGTGKFVDQGFYLNDSLNNFSKGSKNPNRGDKHKFPRSYTAPTIIEGKDFTMGIGSPGGNKIPTILNQVMIQYFNDDKSIQDIIDKPRFYNDGDTVYYEKDIDDDYLKQFKKMGYKVKQGKDTPYFGSVQAAILNKENNAVETGRDVGNR
ncbi:gamma-glutamyltransferase [Mammaliicoccus vitulinus]|uniref:gamma-glutamyltransferase n=1 Tax=Mammaliicoccus vitulinus TaxID=71237 RepID=UPI00195058DE|nr:gamma-glutamyltransferase [Mammaliicoccus vitulinus]MBM6630251.1 gamma-glutamyltransferase [Mammaliicoccus vitulinus]WQK87719.1 gamma-glutamyltransferase [Mammaliicoccus vitulinus]